MELSSLSRPAGTPYGGGIYLGGPGKRADLIICDMLDHRWLGYAFGWNPVRAVISAGRLVYEA